MKKLTPMQISALKTLSGSGIFNDFYLAEGTALTIKYDHRFSEDFDFFLFPDKKTNFSKIGRLVKQKKILESLDDTLIFVYQGIKFSLFEYPYSLIEKPVFNEKLNISISSDVDISCMKSIAIVQRGEKKDFFDLWFLMKTHNWTLEDVIQNNLKKYGDNFNPTLFLKSLIYFEDAENTRIKEIDTSWNSIKDFFIKVVKKYIDK